MTRSLVPSRFDVETTGARFAGPVSPGPAVALDPVTWRRIADRIELAAERAHALGRGVLMALSVPVSAQLDPSSVACASRRPGERWFCFEHPNRDRFSLAALGRACEIDAAGTDRFHRLAADWRALAADAVADPGLLALGGFAFAPDGGSTAHWSGFPASTLVVPELALVRRGQAVELTLAALVEPDDLPREVLRRLRRRMRRLRDTPLPALDAQRLAQTRVSEGTGREHYLSGVARAVRDIRAQELKKVVLARYASVQAPTALDQAAIFGALRERFPQCCVFLVGTGEAALVGATPELLVRREGMSASTVALAGTARRGVAGIDAELGEQLLRSAKNRHEQAIVQRRIERTLRRHALSILAAEEPELVRIANVQHLSTSIVATLAWPIGALELAGLLHPTPAVGGEPGDRAAQAIARLEGFDRGWYAGGVGWTDAAQNGEFWVGLRCALVRGRSARGYAGAGIVRDSNPESELAETDVKLSAILSVLADAP